MKKQNIQKKRILMSATAVGKKNQSVSSLCILYMNKAEIL